MRELIKLWGGGCAALAVLTSTVWAGDQVSVQRAVDALKAEVPLVKLYEQGGRITRVYGKPMAFGTSPEDSAQQFLFSHADIFGVDAADLELVGLPASDFLVQPVMFDQDTGDYRFYLLRYIQKDGEIPVFRADARLLVRNAADFPLVLVAANLRDLGSFSAPVGAQAISAQRAQTVATEMVPGLVNFTEPETVIWAGVDDSLAEPAVALTFVGDNYDNPDADAPEKWLFVIDAYSGAVLYQENRIIFTDVIGNVSGNATEGNAAEQCGDEVPTPMPYALVTINGTSDQAYADANGDFVIPHGGTSSVTVESRVRGQWFVVSNDAGAGSVQSETVTPPGPADFLHNPDNTELVRAEVNAYVQANVVRDFVLTYVPDFPLLDQEQFPILVNETTGYCPCNAWYDYSSLTFCRAGGGCPNTAFSTVVHHEYGHHLVNATGSSQDQYGEGMADVIGVLITDDSGLAYGFFGDCGTPLRDADNDMQYPCYGGAHTCGMLISGCVWDTRNELALTHPDDYRDILSSIVLNAMLIHSGSSQITPQITIDYLTVDDTDGDIYNGTPHGQEICAGFSAHNMGDVCDDITFSPIGFQYPEGRPAWVPPAQETSFAVHVVPLAGTPVSGSGELHYRIDDGSWTTVTMTETAPNEYEATLPASSCGHSYTWYVSAEAVGQGTITDPFDAPTAAYFTAIATDQETVLEDSFETDQGWTVGAPDDDATTGIWNRMDPQATAAQPGDDHTVDGTMCWVTDGRAGTGVGTYDVDGGKTTLFSPTFDLSGYDRPVISYWRWYSNDEGASPSADVFVVDISNDGGDTWVNAETVGPAGPEASTEEWFYHEFAVTDFFAEPSGQVMLRFIASDEGDGSIVEAAIDDLMVVGLVCDDCLGDLDGDGRINLSDLAILLANYPTASGAQPSDGDLDGDGDIDLSDLASLLAVYGTDCP